MSEAMISKEESRKALDLLKIAGLSYGQVVPGRIADIVEQVGPAARTILDYVEQLEARIKDLEICVKNVVGVVPR